MARACYIYELRITTKMAWVGLGLSAVMAFSVSQRNSPMPDVINCQCRTARHHNAFS